MDAIEQKINDQRFLIATQEAVIRNFQTENEKLKKELGVEKVEREIEKTVDDEAILGYREENKECRQILEKQLDRDKDPNDSLRDLVAVACNALYWARAKKKHFVMAKLQAENERLKSQLQCKNCQCELPMHRLGCPEAKGETALYAKIEKLQAENKTLHKKLIILRNAKCPKCDFRFKIRKLIK